MKRNVWLAGMAAALAVGMTAGTPMSSAGAQVIPEGVYVGNLSLAGMTEESAKAEVASYVKGRLAQDITLDIAGNSVAVKAEELGLSWENEDAVGEAVKDARLTGNPIRRYMKKKDLEVSPLKISLEMAVDQDKVSAFVDEKCSAFMTQARDASIAKEGDQFVITPSEAGVTVDIETTKRALNEALNGSADGPVTVAASVTEQQPKITTEDLSSIKDVLGTFSTDFSSSGESRATNLKVGSGKINGHVLMPGETLSGYDCMHPFTTANGYRTAIAYENGRSVDSVGGGVCQLSTTLYNASLRAELDIVQRQNHSMIVTYVKPSMDAAIAGTYKDLKIRNPYDTPIYVEGYTKGRTLTFTIYGKETRPANRTIAFESETLRRMDPGAPVEQVDNSLSPGQKVKVQGSHTGLQSRLYKCVYEDGQLKERTLLSTDTYNASKAIYRVGPAAAAAAPAETQPAETQPDPRPVETQPAETQPAQNYEPGPGAPPAPAPEQTPQPEPAPDPGDAGPGAGGPGAAGPGA